MTGGPLFWTMCVVPQQLRYLRTPGNFLKPAPEGAIGGRAAIQLNGAIKTKVEST
jgi:hypothetical protein